MLTDNTVEIATNLSKVLAEEGLVVTPKPGSLMSELTSSMNNKINFPEMLEGYEVSSMDHDYVVKDFLSLSSAGEGGDAVASNNVLSDLADNTGYVMSEHDALMDNYAVDIGHLASNYMSFAHSTVNSKVSELADAIIASSDKYSPKEAEDFFEVSFYKLDEVFHSPFVSEEINEDNVSSKWEFQYMNLSELKDMDITTLGLFETGHEFTDNSIRSYLATIENPKSLILDYEYTPTEVIYSIESSFVNFLFYRNMSINPRVNTGDSLAVIKDKSLENSKYFAHELYQALKLYKSILKTGRLTATSDFFNFSFLNNKTYKVTVISDNFDKAVDQGCNIETLYGILSSSDKVASITVDEMVEHKEKYLSAWTRVRSLYLTHLNESTLETFKFIVRNELDNSLLEDNITDAEKEVLESKPDFIKETIRLANIYIDNLSRDNIDCVDKVALEIVAGIRFRFSNAYTILKRMEDIMKLDDKVEPQEAAVLSLIDYMIDYVTSQLTCNVG